MGSGSKNENGVTSCTVSRARKGVLQVIEIGLKSGSSNTKAWALCDTGSTHSWVSEDAKSCLGLVGSSETVYVRGVTGSLEGDTSCVNLELFSLEDESFIPPKFSALVRAGLSLGDEKLDLKNVKSCCPHLKVIKADVIDYSKISVILGQDVYSAICPIGYQTSDNHLPWAVKLPIGWVLSGPLPNCKSLKSSVCFASSGASVRSTGARVDKTAKNSKILICTSSRRRCHTFLTQRISILAKKTLQQSVLSQNKSHYTVSVSTYSL